MGREQAEITANVVMIAAASTAAYLILRNPRRRRLAWQLARRYVAGPLAVWGIGLVREAWVESGRARIA